MESFDRRRTRFVFEQFEGEKENIKTAVAQNLVLDMRPGDEQRARLKCGRFPAFGISAFAVGDVADFKERMFVHMVGEKLHFSAPIMHVICDVLAAQSDGAIVQKFGASI